MKKYRIDKSRNIGNVVFVVEGGRPDTGGTELRLLKRIFSDIFGYEVRELRRGCDEFIGYGDNLSCYSAIRQLRVICFPACRRMFFSSHVYWEGILNQSLLRWVVQRRVSSRKII